MSKKNRKKEYDKLVAINGLDRDDGALVREFGNPAENPAEMKKTQTEPEATKPKGKK